MAQESLDLFLEIVKADGTPLKGESSDDVYGQDPHFAIELDTFDMSFEEAGFNKAEDDKTESSKKAGTPVAKAGADSKKDPTRERADKLNRQNDQIASLSSQLKKFEQGRIVVERSFKVKKGLDAASPGLYLAYCQRMAKAKRAVAAGETPKTKFKSAAVKARKAGTTQQPFLILTFDKVSVETYSLSLDGPVPVENVGFRFEAVRIEYAEQKAAGDLTPYSSVTGDFSKFTAGEDSES